MNFLQHRQKSPGHVLPMPEGLEELMGDISREVLRCQPPIDCTYKFIADYLEAMVNTRDKAKIAMGVIEEAILKTDEVYSQFVKCNFPKEKTDSFLDLMEITFRRFVEQKRKRKHDPKFITFQADDMLEELIRKCDLTKVEILRSRPAIQWAYWKFVNTYVDAVEGTLDTEALYVDTEKLVASSKELCQMHESAIQIQKVFRGYQTRKGLQKNEAVPVTDTSSRTYLQPTTDVVSSSSSFQNFLMETERHEELTKAAIKIQASYKGFHVRKTANPKKSVVLRPTATIPVVSSFGTNGHCLSRSEPIIDEENMTAKLVEEHVEQLTDLSTGTEDEPQKFLEEFKEISNDTDLNEAAVKIQASYKGYKVRKEMQELQRNKQNLPSLERLHLLSQSSTHII